jgi:hypothetical protein
LWIASTGDVLNGDAGTVLCFAGEITHGGYPIRAGTRWIMVRPLHSIPKSGFGLIDIATPSTAHRCRPTPPQLTQGWRDRALAFTDGLPLLGYQRVRSQPRVHLKGPRPLVSRWRILMTPLRSVVLDPGAVLKCLELLVAGSPGMLEPVRGQAVGHQALAACEKRLKGCPVNIV